MKDRIVLTLFHEMCSSYCGSSTSFHNFTKKAGTLDGIPLESPSPVFIGILFIDPQRK